MNSAKVERNLKFIRRLTAPSVKVQVGERLCPTCDMIRNEREFEFGSQVWSAFGEPPYHVGSSLGSKTGWRDVDVRVILDDGEYEQWGLGDPERPHDNAKWIALVLAFSALGKAMTGLPVDFQIQQRTNANEKFKGPRSALGIVPLRMAKQPEEVSTHD